MLAMRKGIVKPFTDGAGLCSPGRWPMATRRLPSDETAKDLQQLVLRALFGFDANLRKKETIDLRHLLLKIAVGKVRTSHSRRR